MGWFWFSAIAPFHCWSFIESVDGCSYESTNPPAALLVHVRVSWCTGRETCWTDFLTYLLLLFKFAVNVIFMKLFVMCQFMKILSYWKICKWIRVLNVLFAEMDTTSYNGHVWRKPELFYKDSDSLLTGGWWACDADCLLSNSGLKTVSIALAIQLSWAEQSVCDLWGNGGVSKPRRDCMFAVDKTGFHLRASPKTAVNAYK